MPCCVQCLVEELINFVLIFSSILGILDVCTLKILMKRKTSGTEGIFFSNGLKLFGMGSFSYVGYSWWTSSSSSSLKPFIFYHITIFLYNSSSKGLI